MAPNRRDALRGSNPLAPRSGLEDLTDSMLPPKSSSLVKSSDGTSLLFKQFKLTNVGMVINGPITYADWEDAGRFLKQVEGARNFWLGDWMLACKSEWGQTYTLAESITGLTKDTLSDIAGVCGKVQLPFRNGNCDFTIHRAVAPLGPEKQRHYLTIAEQEHLSVAKLRLLIERDANPDQPVVVEQSPLLNKTHWKVLRRLRKGLEIGDPKKVSRSDIQHVRVWLDDIEQALDDSEKGAQVGADNANS